MKTSERWADGPSVLESIWRFRYFVILVTLLAGVAGYFLSQAQDEVYETSARLHLTNPATSGVFQQQGGLNLDRYIPQQTERVQSTQVLAAAAEELDLGVTPESLRRQIEVEGDSDLGTLNISVQDGSGETAAAIANTVAVVYQDGVRATQLERVGRAVDELELSGAAIQAQIDELLAEATAADLAPGGQVSTQVAVLTQRLVEVDTLGQQLLVDARLFGSGVEFVEEAEVPTAPVAPTPRRTAAATAVLAALFASAFAYWRAGRGRRIEQRDEPAAVLDVPLLGVLPTYKPPRIATLSQRTTLEPRTAEAYRFVYSSLLATLREVGASSVMVTSATPGVGKTETALQIAATASRRGQRTLLIDADLRMRGLTGFLRADRVPGLLDLAHPREGFQADALTRQFPLDAQRHLDVLTAGRATADEGVHLSETWFGAVFEQAIRGYELAVVDSPPLLAVADTATIAGYTDAIVLVVREGSDLDELERVRHRLRFVQQRLIGYVYLSPNALDDTDFDYGLVRRQANAAATRDAESADQTWPGPPADGSSVRLLPDGRTRTGSREPRR